MTGGESSESLIEAALRDIADRDWTRAIARFDAYLAVDPERIDALLHLVRCHLEVGEYGQARKRGEVARQLAEPGPWADACQRLLARCGEPWSDRQMVVVWKALRRRNFDRARHVLERLVSHRPDDVLARDSLIYTADRVAGDGLRAPRPPSDVPSQAAIDRVVEWVLRPRFDEAVNALRAGDLTRAYNLLHWIERFDERGTRAAYLLAQVHHGYLARIDLAGVDDAVLDGLMDHLRRASTHVEHAGNSAGLRQQVEQLRSTTALRQGQIYAVRCDISFQRIHRKYVECRTRYLGHPLSDYEFDGARTHVYRLYPAVSAHLSNCPTNSPHHARLRQIELHLAMLKRQFVSGQ
ncbi:hypothetical protein GCM10009557_36110 [Virgisporangium ochraceum]|uniref:Tetratricopeptide repeat protein n=1 Tax=Virgisporangium ochraceum TaxID=65505 RepID=A0A8J4EA45_9ACTN|nr:tetratricopeptide repeat protein [Virgisporangium ochraceum]GIJ67915.1 hypothetical protein Voc01_028320 [Virgisporangium ochraceum]